MCKTWLRIAVLIGLAGAVGCSSPATTLEQLMEARRLAADLIVQFTKAADAANRAVMADTDEVSVAFAADAAQATQAVQSSADALRPVLSNLGYSNEAALLDEFDRRFAEYRTLDRSILELAVENSNLKAQRLSFGPAQEAADAFQAALEALAPAEPGQDAWRIKALVATAVMAVREIQALQAPHIAEPDDAAMTSLEKRMGASEGTARSTLDMLAAVIRPESRAQMAGATAALDRFASLNAEIIALSRRNTNVRSLALSLGQKRTVTAACEESLSALQGALAKRGFTATR